MQSCLAVHKECLTSMIKSTCTLKGKVQLREQIKCLSHEKNLEKLKRYMQVTTGVYRPKMSNVVTQFPHAQRTFVPFSLWPHFPFSHSESQEISPTSPFGIINAHQERCPIYENTKFPAKFPPFKRNSLQHKLRVECALESGPTQSHVRVWFFHHLPFWKKNYWW